MKLSFLPTIKKMIVKEEKYLTYLKNNNANINIINQSESFLNNLKTKYEEYQNYFNIKID